VVKEFPPEGYSISSLLLQPAILIQPGGNPFAASLVGTVRRKGETHHFPVVAEGANYVADGNCLKPLPRDANAFFHAAIANRNKSALSFPDVIALMRSPQDNLPVIVDEAIFRSANDDAASCHLPEEIPGLHATLYPYQAHGIAWMSQCIGITGGLILADQMGLGKTIQIIGLLLIHPPTPDNPALIVCPTTLIANWAREIEKFTRGMSIMIHRGSGRAGIYKHLMSTQIVITTYDTVVNDISIIRSVPWSFVIADEAQAIKNPSSQRRAALIQIPKRHAIAMTGTPVENSLKDLWSLADFTIPGILGTENEFERQYPDSIQCATDLSKITAPFILKRRVADVAADLPERIDCDLPVELGDDLSLEYEKIRRETLLKYPIAGALVATGQLQLFCAHPRLRAKSTEIEDWENSVFVDSDAEGPLLTPKMELTIELLYEAFTSGRKVLVFSIFNQVGELIREAGAGLPKAFWGVINGSTEQSRRQEIVDEFTTHEGPGVLILNPKAAGAGLNITAATVVIHYTQVWNPAIEAQASARAHRRGQDMPVTIYRLFYKDTVESVMLDRTLWKQSLADDAVIITNDRNRDDLAKALSISPSINA
jgi:SNF2 family DNA or RNA helicase